MYFNIYSEQEKKKFRANFSNFMKRKFGFIYSKGKQEVFDKFDEGHSNFDGDSSEPVTSAPILELKYDYPMEITNSIQYINKFLSRNK